MEAIITTNNKKYTINLNQPIDISIKMVGNDTNPIAWYLDAPEIKPVVVGDWIGKVSEGKSSTNFFNISFNPHAHGTHTECLGHITNHHYSIQDTLKSYFFYSKLISVEPQKINEDFVITLNQIKSLVSKLDEIKALIIRTLPNSKDKTHKNYSHTNPAYLDAEAAKYLVEIGIEHLLIDLPSVDKEKDDGKLLAHKAFWNVKNTNQVNTDARFNATITEMIFVSDNVLDNYYFVNLQISNFENDASPSKPILYKILNHY